MFSLIDHLIFFNFQIGHLLPAVHIQKLQRSKCRTEEKTTDGNPEISSDKDLGLLLIKFAFIKNGRRVNKT